MSVKSRKKLRQDHPISVTDPAELFVFISDYFDGLPVEQVLKEITDTLKDLCDKSLRIV